MDAHAPEQFVISYLNMRRAIGVLAMSLPWVMVVGGYLFGGENLLPSFSAYLLVYRVCGAGMLMALLIFLLLQLPPLSRFGPERLNFYVEAACLTLFGFSWLTKGEVGPFKDKKPVATLAMAG